MSFGGGGSWEGKGKKKKDALKAMNLFMDISLKLSSKDLTLFFPACVCIYKSECVRMCVYTSCSIMSLACVRKCISARPLWACVCVCVSAWACAHFWQISRRITVISYFHF